MYVSEDEPTVLAYSDNDRTNNELGMEYLVKVFERGTAAIAASETRPLILDGHASHTSPEFLIFALGHNIIVLCLPSHTGHIYGPCVLLLLVLYLLRRET